MNPCPTCGGTLPAYSASFVKLWETAMRWFPIYALPPIKACVDCMLYKAGRPVSGFYLDRRERWLRSGTEIPALDKETVARHKKGGERYRKGREKLLNKQREKMRKIWMRREMRKLRREEKKRLRAIREVLERAVED